MKEINTALQGLDNWCRVIKLETAMKKREPLGVVLIISAWNFPINLLFTPLVGALAAGILRVSFFGYLRF